MIDHTRGDRIQRQFGTRSQGDHEAMQLLAAENRQWQFVVQALGELAESQQRLTESQAETQTAIQVLMAQFNAHVKAEEDRQALLQQQQQAQHQIVQERQQKVQYQTTRRQAWANIAITICAATFALGMLISSIAGNIIAASR